MGVSIPLQQTLSSGRCLEKVQSLSYRSEWSIWVFWLDSDRWRWVEKEQQARYAGGHSEHTRQMRSRGEHLGPTPMGCTRQRLADCLALGTAVDSLACGTCRNEGTGETWRASRCQERGSRIDYRTPARTVICSEVGAVGARRHQVRQT